MLDQVRARSVRVSFASRCAFLSLVFLLSPVVAAQPRDDVRTVGEAIAAHKPKNAFQIMERPLIQPDGEFYLSVLEFYRQDEQNTVVGRFRFTDQQIARVELLTRQAAVAHATNRTPKSEKLYLEFQEQLARYQKTYYIVLRVTDQTKVLPPAQMRLGTQLVVMGSYVANQNYEFKPGGPQTLPVMELAYVGEVPKPGEK